MFTLIIDHIILHGIFYERQKCLSLNLSKTVHILHNRFLSTGEQEVRVLTLAEQIIAAMPERIKVSGLNFVFK
jgi:hypothetical protein